MIFFVTVLNDFVSKYVVMQNVFFLSSSRHCDRGLKVDTLYYFQIWNKKEHNITINHIIAMYIETAYSTVN